MRSTVVEVCGLIWNELGILACTGISMHGHFHFSPPSEQQPLQLGSKPCICAGQQNALPTEPSQQVLHIHFFNFKMLNNQWHMLSNRFYTFKWQAPQISNKGCLSFYYWQTSVVQLEPLGTSGILLLLRNQTLLLRTEIWKPSGFLELAESQLKPTNHFATNLQEGHQFRDRQKCARRAKCC